MVKSTRDYIKRKLEQSRTHCNYIFQHLSFIEDIYKKGSYPDHLGAVQSMMTTLADLDTMIEAFREVA